MTEYSESDFLQLSGIQHFAFCRRQWALIHIENQWQENFFTVDGGILHEKVHNAFEKEKRNNIIYSRAMPVQSFWLGISGECDMVEFHSSETGVPLKGRVGLWQPIPIEYKRGKPKEHNADELQLCAQAICLEEMLLCDAIPFGYLYYAQPARRTKVEFTDELRSSVKISFAEMHTYFKRGYTPKVKKSKKCSGCSLKDECLPAVCGYASAQEYVEEKLEE